MSSFIVDILIRKAPFVMNNKAPLVCAFDLPCEFSYIGCDLRFAPTDYETWISHSTSHFVNAPLPPMAICTFCDSNEGVFRSNGDDETNWRERMIHLSRHLGGSTSSDDLRPDFWVIEHMWEHGLISPENYAYALKEMERPISQPHTSGGNGRKFVRSNIESDCEWILDCREFKNWIDGTTNDSVLRLQGSPGAGKTVLVSAISHQLEVKRSTGDCVAMYSWCPYLKGANPSIGILRSIITEMLLQKYPGISRVDNYSLMGELMGSEGRLSASSMKRIVSRIRHALKGGGTLWIAIDGVDAYQGEKDENHVLLELIQELCRHDPDNHIKMLFSSRPKFLRRLSYNRGLQIDLDSHPRHRKCLKRYVLGRLSNSNDANVCKVKDILAEEIAGKSKGIFLWARLVMQELLDSEGLEAWNLNEVISSLEEMDLFTLYGRLLGGINDHDRNPALFMLRWITYAARPLHVRELLGALKAETGIEIEESRSIQICRGLLSVDELGFIQLVHSSVREYLQTRMGQNWKEISNEANQIIAHVCLKALSPERFLQSFKLSPKSGSWAPDWKATAELLSFEDYAQSHWMFHYRLAEGTSCFLPGLLNSLLEIALRRQAQCERALHKNHGTSQNSPMNHPAKMSTHSAGFIEVAVDPLEARLLLGAQFGFRGLVELVLAMGANPDVVCGSNGLTPLIWAARNGYIDIVEVLLRYNANPEPSTSLIYTVANGHVEIIKLLVDHCIGNLGNFPMDISVNVSKVTVCETCGETETRYELTPGLPNRSTNGVQNFPPITVMGECVSRAETEISMLKAANNSRSAAKPCMTIKWFPGIQMYRMLATAAERGAEDFKTLLVALGSDGDELDKSICLAKLVAALSLS